MPKTNILLLHWNINCRVRTGSYFIDYCRYEKRVCKRIEWIGNSVFDFVYSQEEKKNKIIIEELCNAVNWLTLTHKPIGICVDVKNFDVGYTASILFSF